MTKEELEAKINALEEIVAQLCRVVIDLSGDDYWRAPFDPLQKFLEEKSLEK